MKSKLRFRLVCSGASVCAAVFAGWLLTGDDSPLRDYFLHNVFLPNVWRMVNVPPYVLGMFVSGNLHATTELGGAVMLAAFVGQWALVGLALSKLLTSLGNGLR